MLHITLPEQEQPHTHAHSPQCGTDTSALAGHHQSTATATNSLSAFKLRHAAYEATQQQMQLWACVGALISMHSAQSLK
jgi:hypothetical protein